MKLVQLYFQIYSNRKQLFEIVKILYFTIVIQYTIVGIVYVCVFVTVLSHAGDTSFPAQSST